MKILRDVFCEGVALDLGTVNTLAAIRGKGIVLREPSAVAVSTGEDREIIEIGSKAMLMLGRTPGQLTVCYPMRDGVISDMELAEAMIRFCIREALGRKAGPMGIRLALCLPLCVSDIERRALMEAAKNAGAREIIVLNEALAAAIGAGIPVTEPIGHMVVDMGGGTTDAAVVTLGGIAAHKSVRTGGTHLDKAIVEYIGREYRLSIGERTAEQVKMNIGSALLGGEEHMQIRGRNMETGIPESIIVGRGEISYAIKNEVRDMVNAIKETLAQTPPELAGDIYDTGITLTGGGANLDGIAELVGRETGMAVRVAEDPENCVVKGALMALDMGEEAGIYHEAVSA
ncbi:MAG: rod shape-determining protein [Clostridia bacterium]|nr:rod shape-determining protein [Clostridia bacterium]